MILLFLTLFLNVIDQTKQDTIAASETARHISQQAIVKAKVVTVFYAEKVQGKPTYLNLKKKFPNNPMAVVIYKEDLTKLKINANDYKGKTIIVKRKMIEVPYENGKKPCIRIYNSNQIKVVNEEVNVIEGIDL